MMSHVVEVNRSGALLQEVYALNSYLTELLLLFIILQEGTGLWVYNTVSDTINATLLRWFICLSSYDLF